MAKKKDLIVELLILLFVAACTLIILRALYRNVRLELWIRDNIGMRPAAPGIEPRSWAFGEGTRLSTPAGRERMLSREAMIC